MKKKYIKICPKCKSIDIGLRPQSLWFFGLPPTFKCNKCNYIGYIFPEIKLTEKNIKKFKKWNSQKRKNDRNID